ncbi:hypothetical protein COU75_03535 [Candidatus Peregrinibacteria bacterium CG10_big_fil_rev_8_21_14_0_10_42_8]|nr:MAG: hypothetical protein COU75_03535 [Candidatus Peregrinibacteria bacterium CG10_big_fil_rev_8_21_14_0_10_42_8]
MTSIAHIVNPFYNPKRQDLEDVQPLVCESMLRAQDFAKNDVTVELYATVYKEDENAIPKGFLRAPGLTRSIINVRPLQKPKKLPLIYDIIDNLFQVTTADYLIYTNMDIILMPHFYSVVHDYIHSGYDGIIINRREVNPTEVNPLDTLAKIWSSIGVPGAGYDCFVFSRKQYAAFYKDTCCIGIASVDTGLAANIMKNARQFLFLPFEHITCHIGNDRQWTEEEFDELTRHNLWEFSKIWPLHKKRLVEQFGSTHPMIKRMSSMSSYEFPTFISDYR